jgi:membrane-bound metal-dependent hydrolase YbcI (DUF457 family)
MSSYRTHALIGAAGGMVAARIDAHASIEIVLLTVGASAALALWPDIDQAGSFASNWVDRTGWLLGAVIGLAFRRGLEGVLVGALVGLLAIPLLVRGARKLVGGHRRGTHSLVIVLALVALSWRVGPLPLLFAYGGILHILGDVVTPGGVCLFWPIYRQDIYCLPRFVARYGEALAALAALLVIGVCLL